MDFEVKIWLIIFFSLIPINTLDLQNLIKFCWYQPNFGFPNHRMSQILDFQTTECHITEIIHQRHYYHHYFYCYYCFNLGLVGSSGKLLREQVVPSNLRSLGLALHFWQLWEMLLFAKALCNFLYLTSSAILSIFLMSFQGLQLQPEQPQLVTNHNLWQVAYIFHIPS